MKFAMTLQGAGLGRTKKSHSGHHCKCVRNSRTGRSVKLCHVGKSKKHRSGWRFEKGGC